VRGLSSGWKDNEIGRRLMQTLAEAKPLTEAEMPPKRRAARRWARKARWWPTCSSCCSRSAAARSTSPPACWRAATIWRRWPPGSGTCRSWKDGASSSSGATRSISSRQAAFGRRRQAQDGAHRRHQRRQRGEPVAHID
jgi:hypothetical protein